MIAFFLNFNFIVLNTERNILILYEIDDITIISIYVDNFLFISKY